MQYLWVGECVHHGSGLEILHSFWEGIRNTLIFIKLPLTLEIVAERIRSVEIYLFPENSKVKLKESEFCRRDFCGKFWKNHTSPLARLLPLVFDIFCVVAVRRLSVFSEQLLASPQKIQSVTLATTRPKSTVAMSTYPANKSEPDVSVDHADAIDGFERALDEQKQAVARGAGIATAGMPRLLALKRGLLSGYSTPPPVRAAMAHSMAAGTSQRSFSLGKTAGRRFKEKAGAAALAYNDDVKLMISRFMSAKVRECNIVMYTVF